MLSAKPWKPDAVARLLVSVFVCVYAGALVLCAMHYAEVGAKAGRSVYWLVAAALVCFGAVLAALRRPWNLETFMRRLAVVLVCFNVGLVLGFWAQKLIGPFEPAHSVQEMVVSLLSLQGAVLLFTWFFLREQQTSWVGAFGLAEHWPRALLLGLMLACAFLPIGYGLQTGAMKLLEHLPFWHPKPEEQGVVQTLRDAASFSQRLVGGLGAVLLAPVAEEVLFRGILYPSLKQAGHARLALWGTSIAFAAIHLHLPSFIPLLILALALTALYEWTRNLLAPIAAHVAFNGLGVANLYLSPKMFLILLLVLALAPLLALLLGGLKQTQDERI